MYTFVTLAVSPLGRIIHLPQYKLILTLVRGCAQLSLGSSHFPMSLHKAKDISEIRLNSATARTDTEIEI